MDRFQWSSGKLLTGESVITSQNGIRLYDGENKSPFDGGVMTLTTHKLEWKSPKDSTAISLNLSLVIFVEEHPASIGKSPKIVLHLGVMSPDQNHGPIQHSPNGYVKLSFKDGGKTNFYECLYSALNRRLWEQLPAITGPAKPVSQSRAGIVGIERTIQERQNETNKNISKAFEDLSKLMEMARDMVSLAKTISAKIKDKQGDISEDETVQFKSYLLSLGIDDPVTRESHGSGVGYHRELAKELVKFIEQPLTECGGMMALTDVYCRMNRARGLELVSPEDLLNACKMLGTLGGQPVRLRVFDSGVMILQLVTHNEEELIEKTTKLLVKKGSLTAEELSQILGISVVLAKERLFSTEKFGGICRDDSVEGLRFYPNLFLTGGQDSRVL